VVVCDCLRLCLYLYLCLLLPAFALVATLRWCMCLSRLCVVHVFVATLRWRMCLLRLCRWACCALRVCYAIPWSDRVGRCTLSLRAECNEAWQSRLGNICQPVCHSERNVVERRIWLGTMCVINMPACPVISSECEKSVRDYFHCLVISSEWEESVRDYFLCRVIPRRPQADVGISVACDYFHCPIECRDSHGRAMPSFGVTG